MLEHFLVQQVFTFLLIFCRIGSAIMVLPGFGETYVSTSIRLSLTLGITLLLTPLLGNVIPPLPASPLSLALLVGTEVLTGLFIGTLCNIMINVTHLAGMIVSFQSGISSAVIFDVTQNSQGSLIGNFMGIAALVMLFATNLHHLMLRGITDSYVMFAPGHLPPVHDFVEAVSRLVSDVFIMAVQITTPALVAGTLLFLGAGVLARLMPTMQVFFVVIPIQLLVGFFVLMTTFSAVMLWYMDSYRDKLTGFLGYLH